MNSLIEYHNNQFFNDLEILIKSSEGTDKIISLVSLSETDKTPGFYGVVRNAFNSLNDKELFLTVYMFYVLFDQATYELKEVYEKTVPRLGGILGSYGSNFHPAHLMFLATSYIDKNSEGKFIDDFKEYTFFILGYYKETLTSRSKSQEKYNLFFHEIANSMKKEELNLKINRYFFRNDTVKIKVADECLKYFSEKASEYIMKVE